MLVGNSNLNITSWFVSGYCQNDSIGHLGFVPCPVHCNDYMTICDKSIMWAKPINNDISIISAFPMDIVGVHKKDHKLFDNCK